MPLPASPFVDRLVRFLLPYFMGTCPDLDSARAEILDTLASYGTQTRSGLLNAAQIIAYGLSGLDTLHEAKTTEMSQSMRLRYRGCANNLSRSCQKTEQILAKRVAHEAVDAAKPAAGPANGVHAVEPADDVPDPKVQEAIQDAQTKIAAFRDRLAAGSSAVSRRPVSASQQEENKRLWGGAMMNALAQMGMPVQPVSP